MCKCEQCATPKRGAPDTSRATSTLSCRYNLSRLKMVHTVLEIRFITNRIRVEKMYFFFFLIIKKLQWIEKHSNSMCMHSVRCDTVYSGSDIVHYHYVPCTPAYYIIIRACNLCGRNPFLTFYARAWYDWCTVRGRKEDRIVFRACK